MSCAQAKDGSGYYWSIPSEPNSNAADVWWSRDAPKRVGSRVVQDEHLIIRQVNNDDNADVLMLTLGQVYDLIDALNKAVDRP